jgi:hypothetical protein
MRAMAFSVSSTSSEEESTRPDSASSCIPSVARFCSVMSLKRTTAPTRRPSRYTGDEA